MTEKGLASLRKQFSALQTKHDGADFRFIVEMLFHCEPLESSDFDEDVWKAANKALDILYKAEADLGKVYKWSKRGPHNSTAVRDVMFLTHAQL
jgi:hypothetical protein